MRWLLVVLVVVGCESHYGRSKQEQDCIDLVFACMSACSSTTMVQEKVECQDFCLDKKYECLGKIQNEGE